jgi:hypothetical protein
MKLVNKNAFAFQYRGSNNLTWDPQHRPMRQKIRVQNVKGEETDTLTSVEAHRLRNIINKC